MHRVLPRTDAKRRLARSEIVFSNAIGRIFLGKGREQSLELFSDLFLTDPHFPENIDELAVVAKKSASSGRGIIFQTDKKAV